MSGKRNSARLRAQKKETLDAKNTDTDKATKPTEQQQQEEEEEQQEEQEVENVIEITPSDSEDSDDDAPEEETFGNAKQQAAAKEKEITKLVETKKSQERAERRKRDQVLKDQKQEKKKQAAAEKEQESEEEVRTVVDISDNEDNELLPAELLEQYEDDVQTKRKTRSGSAEEAAAEPKKRKIAEVIKTVKNKRTVFDKGVVQVKVLESEAAKKQPTRKSSRARSKLLLPPAAASGKDGVNKSSLTAEWLNRKTLDRRGRVTQKFDKRKWFAFLFVLSTHAGPNAGTSRRALQSPHSVLASLIQL